LSTRLVGPETFTDVPVTFTTMLEVLPPTVAVTVIARMEGSPDTERVAVAAPEVSVMPGVPPVGVETASPPEEA